MAFDDDFAGYEGELSWRSPSQWFAYWCREHRLERGWSTDDLASEVLERGGRRRLLGWTRLREASDRPP